MGNKNHTNIHQSDHQSHQQSDQLSSQKSNNILYSQSTNQLLQPAKFGITLPFQPSQLTTLYTWFSQSDTQNTGILNFDGFINSVHQQQCISQMSTKYVIKWLFQVISKKNTKTNHPKNIKHKRKKNSQTTNKIGVGFGQWVMGISAFCLYGKQQLVRFVFEMIDQDMDDRITKSQIIEYLTCPVFSNKQNHLTPYPSNHIKAIESIQLSRSASLTFQQFRKLINQNNFRFIGWPAFRLQQKLRKNLFGQVFWQKMHLKIEKIQSQLKSINTKQRDQIEIQKQNKKKNKNKQIYDSKSSSSDRQIFNNLTTNKQLLKIFRKNRKTDYRQNRFKQQFFERKPGKRSSDSNLISHHFRTQGPQILQKQQNQDHYIQSNSNSRSSKYFKGVQKTEFLQQKQKSLKNKHRRKKRKKIFRSHNFIKNVI